ncbi:TatD family hydrolase [Bowmanella dokdonensis]|uniref:TatD family hydrolase n=1 Tax=Bowmanella dokdonensis TaxID=751969 RepID=UPI0030B9ED43
MTNRIIDSHCHLDFSAFDADRDQVLLAAVQAGVEHIVVPGVSASQWPELIGLANRHDRLSFALGLHPYFLNEFKPEHLTRLDKLLEEQRGRVVAVGEIGLDFALDLDAAFQERVFEAQLQLAGRHQLPVIVHHRKSHHRILYYLKRTGFSQGGVIHAFSGSLQQAQAYIERGFMLGIGGTISYKRAGKTREAVSQLPLDALLLETDAPDMPLCGRQGQRNSPQYLPRVLDALEALRKENRQTLARQTRQNTIGLFDLNNR